PFPWRRRDLARGLPPRTVARLARDTAARRWDGVPGDSLEAVLRRRVGTTLYQQFYGPYAEKLWGLPGAALSVDQPGRPLSPDGARVYHYPRHGFGQICERLAEAAAKAGARIELGLEVDGVKPTFDDVCVHARGGHEVTAGIAFCTLPLPVLGRVTTPGPSLAVVEDAAGLRRRSVVFVYVVHQGGRWTSYDSHHLPELDTPVTRISEPVNYRDSAADPRDHSVVCAEIPCDAGNPVWVAGDDALGDLVEEAVRRAGLPPLRRGDVVTRRLRDVSPVYDLGYRRRLAGIERWVAGVPQVVTFGRLGLQPHSHDHRGLLEAYDAVDALGLDGRFDLSRWRRRRAAAAAGDRDA
ncbi:MAG: FAD-dependent oxidoreductase, partial [Actinomycetota bacterium]|nr:FAD-dependent oxidoreductase [Actinomycetota bacterium]